MRRWAAGLVVASVVLSPDAASAFLLVGKTKTPPSDKARVVALRDGRSTVLSIQIRVREKTGEIALLVPVPAAEITKTLSLGAFASLGQVTVPRIAELFEVDPCALHPVVTPKAPVPDAAHSAKSEKPAPKPPAAPADAPNGFRVDVVGGKGAEVIAALKSDGYDLPADAEPILAQYLDGGMKLVVAKIDLAKLGDAAVPPLLVSYASDDLTLSTRLFASSGGVRDVEVYVLSPGHRFEAENQGNLAVPTNLDVSEAARAKLSPFYSAVLTRAFEKAPKSVVTEYAWRASTCELCSAPLEAEALKTLGSDLLSSAREGKQLEVLIDAEQVSSEPGGPDTMRSALASCYAAVLADKPGLAGALELDVVVANGSVSSATPKNATGAASEGSFTACATSALTAAKLDKSGTLKVDLVPLSRQYFSDLVLTKLHARYDSVPDKDLRLKKARAIGGGREIGPEGKAEKKVYWAPSDNDLQPRYVIRHPFTGAIRCETPERGVWATHDDKAKPSKTTDTEPVTSEALDKLVVGGLPDVAGYVIAASEVETPAPAPNPEAPSAPPSPSPSASVALPVPSAAPPPAKPDAGCGSCSSAPTENQLPWSGLIASLLVAIGIRRRKSVTLAKRI